MTSWISLAGTTSLSAWALDGSTGSSAGPLDHSQGFDGINEYQQWQANGGRGPVELEPPDEGMAAGNGYVVNAVNLVLRVYNESGTPLTQTIDLNRFFGYPPDYDPTTRTFGPFLSDPSVYFDHPTHRWFVDVVSNDDDPITGAFGNKSHIDLAVSRTADPRGGWNLYHLPAQDDGTDGTPNHHNGPALPDYPHIGADRNGIYITTNEFPLATFSFYAAQVYAFPKEALAEGASHVPVVRLDTGANPAANPDGRPGFTLIPAITPDDEYAGNQGGTEYLLSSTVNVFYTPTGSENRLEVWALTHTNSLDGPSPSLTLQASAITVNTFTLPPAGDQKPGNFPLGQSLGEHEESLEQFDTRMTQASYAAGKLWGAIETAVAGGSKVGIAWYVISPHVDAHGVSGHVFNQGTLALAGNNLMFPALAVTPSGQGVMSFSVTGRDHYPRP